MVLVVTVRMVPVVSVRSVAVRVVSVRMVLAGGAALHHIDLLCLGLAPHLRVAATTVPAVMVLARVVSGVRALAAITIAKLKDVGTPEAPGAEAKAPVVVYTDMGVISISTV
jgi:hypothetical protein